MVDPKDRAMSVYQDAVDGMRDYEVIFQIPASDNWFSGDEVGWIECDDWLFSVTWANGELSTPHSAILPSKSTLGAPFPASTKWMITDNDAIDHGLEAPNVEA